MANEVSIKAVVTKFDKELDTVLDFIAQHKGDGKGVFVFYVYDYALIKFFKDFEELLVNTIVGLINQEAPYVASSSGHKGTKSVRKKDAENLFIGNRYFGFKGQNGLLKQIKSFFPTNHWFINILSDTKYTRTFDILIPLRNFAAHSSKTAKKNAINAVELQQLGYSGAWLKVGSRFQNIIDDLKDIAARINAQAKF
jgi:hypothetical protein